MTLPHLSGSYFASVETRLGSLLSRISSIDETHIPDILTRVADIEAWHNNPAPASADMETSVTLPTVPVLGLLNTMTKAGVEAAFSTVHTEVNSIKQVLRDRGIIAAS
jgi:hypothetical protein